MPASLSKSHDARRTTAPVVATAVPTHVSSLWMALAGSRISQVVTTRVRAFYERRYKKRTREPISRLVFIFDAVLLLVIALLIGLILNATLRSFTPSLSIRFESSGFGVATPTPIVVILQAPKKGGVHRNIRVFWKLPSGVEILESNPKLFQDGSAYLGTLSPQEEVRLHLIVRTYRPFGETVTIGLQTQEGGLLDARTTYASFDRHVDQLGLSAEIPKEVLADHVVPKGAVLPIRVTNQTEDVIPQVEIRPTEQSSIQFDRQSLGDIAPHSERYVYLPLGSLNESPTVGWSILASSYVVASSTWHAELMEWPNQPEITLASAIKQNSLTHVSIQNGKGSSLVAISPVFTPSLFEFSDPDTNLAAMDFGIHETEQSEQIVIMPIRTIDGGPSRILGSASFGLVLGKLPMKSSIQYLSASGDQIGAGPNPPEANTETRYWTFFKVDQSQNALKNIHVRAMLAQGVEFTGAVAVPDGGTWSTTNRVLDWKLASVPSERPYVLIGAEISVTPSDPVTLPYPLISSVTAEGEDVSTGIVIDAKQGMMSTEDVGR